MTVHTLFPAFDLEGLSARQVQCLLMAAQHEAHRSASRAKDDRLGDETREREASVAKEFVEINRKLRALSQQAGA